MGKPLYRSRHAELDSYDEDFREPTPEEEIAALADDYFNSWEYIQYLDALDYADDQHRRMILKYMPAVGTFEQITEALDMVMDDERAGFMTNLRARDDLELGRVVRKIVYRHWGLGPYGPRDDGMLGRLIRQVIEAYAWQIADRKLS